MPAEPSCFLPLTAAACLMPPSPTPPAGYRGGCAMHPAANPNALTPLPLCKPALPAHAAGYGAASYKAMLEGARRTPADLAAFVELHIEQVGWQGGLSSAPGSARE